jgi:hypothetical protein
MDEHCTRILHTDLAEIAEVGSRLIGKLVAQGPGIQERYRNWTGLCLGSKIEKFLSVVLKALLPILE